MRPVVDGLKREVTGTYDVIVMNLSSGDAAMRQTATELGIEYVPTFVFVKSDGTVAEKVVGTMTRDAMLAKLQSIAP